MDSAPGGDDDGVPIHGDPGDGTDPVTDVSGRIRANTTWMDTIDIV